MAHLSEEQIGQFIQNSGERAGLQPIANHLDTCSRCRESVAEAAALMAWIARAHIERHVAAHEETAENCPDIEDRIAAIDGKLKQDKSGALGEHLQSCSLCAEEADLIRISLDADEEAADDAEQRDSFDHPVLSLIRGRTIVLLAREKKILDEQKEGFLESIKRFFTPLRTVPVGVGFAASEELGEEFFRGLSNEDLLFACRKKSEYAWLELMRRVKPWVTYHAPQWGLGHLKDDVFSHAILLFYQKIDTFEGNFTSTFFRYRVLEACSAIYRRENSSRVKKPRETAAAVEAEREQDELDDDEDFLKGVSAGSQAIRPAATDRRQPVRRAQMLVEYREFLEAIEDAIGRLSVKDEIKQTLHLRLIGGYKHAEIGERLSLPLNTVLSSVNRAWPKLVKIMKHHSPQLWEELQQDIAAGRRYRRKRKGSIGDVQG